MITDSTVTTQMSIFDLFKILISLITTGIFVVYVLAV